MKVSKREGIANQTGPESCVAHREVRDEALTGEPAGQPLSHSPGQKGLQIGEEFVSGVECVSSVPVGPGCWGAISRVASENSNNKWYRDSHSVRH